MNEKAFRKTYFILGFLVLFLIISLWNYNIQQERYLENYLESSYQNMIDNTRNNMSEKYQEEYGVSDERFNEYWEDFKKTEDFEIMKIKYKEELRQEYENLENSIPFYKKIFSNLSIFLLGVLSLILGLISTPLNLILSVIIVIGFYYILRWIYPLVIPKSILKKK
ncbi:MAG: hypothetical protein ABIA78_02605 [archaeon]